jgi:hypothetical protein
MAAPAGAPVEASSETLLEYAEPHKQAAPEVEAPWKQALDAAYAAADKFSEVACEELEPREKLVRCLRAHVAALDQALDQTLDQALRKGSRCCSCGALRGADLI